MHSLDNRSSLAEQAPRTADTLRSGELRGDDWTHPKSPGRKGERAHSAFATRRSCGINAHRDSDSHRG
jgi:hypothetical protein